MTVGTQQQGQRAERVVASYLQRRGLRVEGMNVRVGKFELDIVAQDGAVIAVVEVRTRGPNSWTSGFGSIDWRKRQRIRKAGRTLWRQLYRKNHAIERLRFDAASVVFHASGARVEYAKAAF